MCFIQQTNCTREIQVTPSKKEKSDKKLSKVYKDSLKVQTSEIASKVLKDQIMSDAKNEYIKQSALPKAIKNLLYDAPQISQTRFKCFLDL